MIPSYLASFGRKEFTTINGLDLWFGKGNNSL